MKPIFTLLFLSIVLYLQPTMVYAQPTVTGYTICQGQPVPAGQGLTATVGGSTAPSTLTGSLVAGPTYVRASGNNATAYAGGQSCYYQTFTIVAPVSGSFTIPMLSSYDNYITLYQNSFNPASPATNFLFGDDDSWGAAQGRVIWNFQVGQTYVLVATSYSAGTTGAFSIPLPWTSGNVVEWFSSAVGGTVLGTGGVFNPVGVPGSGITNTNTPGTTTFYAGNQGSPLRSPGDFTISAAPLVTNYAVCLGQTVPAGQGMIATGTGTMQWFTTAVGGTAIGTGSPFNPVGVPGSGITNTNTVTTITYYVQIQSGTCRVPVTFSVSPVLTGTTAYSICQGLSVPAGQGLGAIGGGGAAPSSFATTLTTSSPTYVRGAGNNVTTYNSSGVTVYYQTYTFLCPVSGSAQIALLGTFDNWLGMYNGPFNPAAPATNFVAGDDDSYGGAQARIIYNFVAGTTYTLVGSSYSSNVTGALTFSLPFTPGAPVVWYATASGGSIIGSGTPFNPVGVVGSPLTNTNTIGATTFYATLQGTDCRIPAVFTVTPGVAVTPYTICQGQTVPAGQGITGVSTGGTTQWYTVPTGGTIIATGSTFNPVGVPGSGITNTNTPGVTTFYANNSASATCRIPVTFTIEATPTTTNYNICQSQTVPAGQGMTATIGGSTTPTTLSGDLTATSPTYVRGAGNSVTTYNSSAVTVRYQTFTFVAPVSGSFTIPMLSSFDNWMGMYNGSFNPASPATNFLYGDDDSYGALQARILYNFVAGNTYVLVASSYSAGVAGTFTIPLPFTSAYVTQWFTAPAGGTPFATGGVVNPVGLAGSGIASTNVPGTTTFYVGYQGNTCRVPAIFSINAATNINISTSGSTAICQGSNVVLSVPPGAGYNYQWQQNTVNIPGATNATHTATTAGTYNIVVSAVGLCAIPAAPAVVTVNPVPPATATITSPNPVCEGGTVSVGANTGTGLTYQWMRNNQTISGATSATYSATTSGNYQIVVTNTFNCSTTSTAAAVNIIPNPNSVITYTTNLNFCEGEAVVLNAYTAAGLSYQWFVNGDTITGATSSNYIATTAGAYTLNITNNTGCRGISQALNVNVNPLPVPVVTRTNFTLSTPGTYATYQWYYTSQPISGANGPSYTFTQDGFYNLAVTDTNGCRGLSQTFYASTTGIENVPGGADIKVYPNPAHDIVNIESPRPVNVMIRDLAGRNVIIANDAKQVNIGGIANGTYMVYITNTEGQLIKVEKLQKVE